MYEKLTLAKEKILFFSKNEDDILLHTYVQEIDPSEGKILFFSKNEDEFLLHTYVREIDPGEGKVDFLRKIRTRICSTYQLALMMKFIIFQYKL